MRCIRALNSRVRQFPPPVMSISRLLRLRQRSIIGVLSILSTFHSERMDTEHGRLIVSISRLARIVKRD